VKVSPAHFRVIRSILLKHVPAHPVWAFGSRVHGRNLKTYSDLDLAVIAETPLRLDTLIALRKRFRNPIFPSMWMWLTTPQPMQASARSLTLTMKS
jgi:predicted nucleotidyltransferase